MTRSLRAALVLAVLSGSFVLGAAPAAACSCALSSDQEYLDFADVVFTGELVSYEFEEDPDGDGILASDDPAVWTFAVTDVWKGEAAATQSVYSPVSGASCGLEIPREGTFHVFATIIDEDGFAWGEHFPVGELQSGLCSGTRAADEPLAFDPPVEPRTPLEETSPTDPPSPSPEEPPTDDGDDVPTAAPAPADGPATEATDEPTEADPFAGGIVLVVGFLLVGSAAAYVAARLARKTRQE